MWTPKRIAVVVGSLLLGLALTMAGIRLVWSDFEWLGISLSAVWAATMFGGAYLFPEPMGELGHPIAWVVGIALNSLFLAAVLVAVLTAVRRARRPNRIVNRPRAAEPR